MKTGTAILYSLRLKHWLKNTLIYSALIFSKNLFDFTLFLKVSAGFVLFSLTASSIYLLNDIFDRKEDVLHPQKSKKPIASGELSTNTALLVFFILLAFSLSFSFLLNWEFGVVVSIYFIINFLYSRYLKHVVLLDIFCVSSGFLLRVIAGGLLINVAISNWLIICTGLLALFLSFAKRRHEIVLLGDMSTNHRKSLKEYSTYYLDQMIAVTTSATLISYILYTVSQETIQNFGTNKLIFTTPFVLYGIFRYLYLIHMKDQGGNPTQLLVADKPLLINIFLWLLCAVLVIYHAQCPLF